MPMRVVSSELDPHKRDSDVSGKHTVLYPTNDADLKEALVVAKVLGVRGLLVRSGRGAANNKHVDGTGAMVVNLRKYSGIQIDGNNNVTVCAGATTSSLADKLKKHNLFLPLDGNPNKSVFSNVRSTERGFVPSFSLSGFLAGSQGIHKGKLEFFDNVLHQISDEHIITKMVFKAKTADEVKGYRMTRLCFTYDRALFGDVLRHIFFGENKVVVGDEMDVSVTALSGAYGLPMFTVTAVSPRDSNYMTDMLKRLDPAGDLIVHESTVNHAHAPFRHPPAGRKKIVLTADIVKGADIVEAVAEGGRAIQYPHDAHSTRFSGELVEGKLEDYVDAIHRAIAFSPTPILPRVKMVSTASCKAQDGIGLVGVHASVHAPLLKNQTSAEKQLHEDIAVAIDDPSRAVVASEVDLGQQVAVDNLVGLDVGKRVDLAIPGFAGEVYCPGTDAYDEVNEQYAKSSYPDESDRMTPYAIGFPVDADDVIPFVNFAIQEGKKVVARSGGHQYCGLSSGGADTMLLSMDKLCVIDIKSPRATGEVMAHAGPGSHLTKLAAGFLDNNVTIPHGECPEVCIGGHVQTGGFGHLLRSYGLALDHVKSFDIVLANPVELRTIARPASAVQDGTSSSDDRIFWGVMGGGPGSFGIITNIEFECIKDADHGYSCGYSAAYLWQESVFAASMDVVQKRTKDVFDLKVLPSDCDLMVSVMSSGIPNPLRPAVVMVEMVHGNCSGLPLADDDVGRARMNTEIDLIKASAQIPAMTVDFDPSSHTPLSLMSETFVRNYGMTTYDEEKGIAAGREFKYPYVKRVNCTMTELSDDFVAKFVALVNKTMKTDDVFLIFQMVMGGGAYQGNADKGISSIPRRDIVIGIVFDVFYKPAGEAAANQLHDEFGDLLPIFSNSEDIRVTWGSFGDIDMNNMHDEYYGSGNGLYERLQGLKQELDPQDVFHTPFNVQLPAGSQTCLLSVSGGGVHGGRGGHGGHGSHGGHGGDGRAGKRAKRNR